jgi:predicted nucleic acid-binding protein
MGTISKDEREVAESRLDRWVGLRDLPLNLLPEDFEAARRFIRVHRLLRAPDALHMAVAARNGLAIATFDQRLAQAAMEHGLETVNFGALT